MENKNHNHIKNIRNYPTYIIGLFLVTSVLFISVGFSALSTSLSINGSASFTPVGLIRVMSIEQDNLVGITELNKSITPDSIKNTIDLDNINSSATYRVVIRNLGQIDYVLTRINEKIFSNNQIEYILDDFQIGNIIHANEEITLKIKFKYKDNLNEELVSRLNSELKFVFEEYYDSSSFGTIFSHEGACTFNGTNGITGPNCTEYAGRNYIDTGVSLYSELNWDKDYEIGFTIEDYVPRNQVNQAVFVNTKYEKASLGYPGLVFRRDAATNNLEITQTINNGNKVIQKITNYTLPLEIKIFRIDGIVYYNINGGELIELQDVSNFNQQFDVTTWFGAAADENGNPMRPLKGTLSNMYIKFGTYTPRQYTITFVPNGGTMSSQSKVVDEYTKIGELPVPTINNGTSFIGWYSDPNLTNRITADDIINQSITLYAKWTDAGAVKMNDTYYDTITEAINSAPDNVESTITIYKQSLTKRNHLLKQQICFV